jgi:hypothetical protein
MKGAIVRKVCKILIISVVAVIIGAMSIVSIGCSGNGSSLKSGNSKAENSENNQVSTETEKSQAQGQTGPAPEEGKPDQAPPDTPGEGFIVDSNTIIAVILGITVDDLMAELNEGKTIAEVANEKDIEAQTLIDSYLKEFSNKLDEAVTDGKITQEEADKMLENEKNTIEDRINNTMPMPEEGKPGPNK